MEGNGLNSHRQQQLYWNQMIELKVAASYMRLYRDDLGTWVARLAILKAVASSGSVAGWVVWKEYAFVWGAIIAVSQLADALKDVFPFTKTHKAASEVAVVLGAMFIDAQLEWENIFSGRHTDDQIVNRRYKLTKLQHATEQKSFPHGLPFKKALFEAAQAEATGYFATTYGVE
jgi:hypothetical protein